MKGLLKNNFIGVIENLKLLFPLAIIFGIIVSITGNASLLSIYSLSITPILLLLVVLCMRKETLRWYLGDFYWFIFLSTLLFFWRGKNWNYCNHKFGCFCCCYCWNKPSNKCIHWWKCVWYDILYKFNSNCNYYLLHFCMFLFFISIYFSCKRVLVLWLRAKVIYRGVYDKT